MMRSNRKLRTTGRIQSFVQHEKAEAEHPEGEAGRADGIQREMRRCGGIASESKWRRYGGRNLERVRI